MSEGRGGGGRERRGGGRRERRGGGGRERRGGGGRGRSERRGMEGEEGEGGRGRRGKGDYWRRTISGMKIYKLLYFVPVSLSELELTRNELLVQLYQSSDAFVDKNTVLLTIAYY